MTGSMRPFAGRGAGFGAPAAGIARARRGGVPRRCRAPARVSPMSKAAAPRWQRARTPGAARPRALLSPPPSPGLGVGCGFGIGWGFGGAPIGLLGLGAGGGCGVGLALGWGFGVGWGAQYVENAARFKAAPSLMEKMGRKVREAAEHGARVE